MFHSSTHNKRLKGSISCSVKKVIIYLDHLDGVEEGEGERDQHQQQGADGEEVGDKARTLITHN